MVGQATNCGDIGPHRLTESKSLFSPIAAVLKLSIRSETRDASPCGVECVQLQTPPKNDDVSVLGSETRVGFHLADSGKHVLQSGLLFARVATDHSHDRVTHPQVGRRLG